MNKYKKIRKILREYKLLKKELECRTNYILEFKKILVEPLPNSEETLHKIYKNIITEMEATAKKTAKRLNLLNSILEKLEGIERNVIYYRYIEGIDWVSMPEYLMYEQRSCQLYENRALEKITKMKIDWSEFDAK